MKTAGYAAAVLAVLAAACTEADEVAPRPTAGSATDRVVATGSVTAPVLTLDWDGLLPEGEDERLTRIYETFYENLEQQLLSSEERMLSDVGTIAEGSALDAMPQLGTFNTVDDLDGRRIEIPGFVVPLDVNGPSFRSFLIVPYFGACIHTPPPPPNQLIYAVAEPAVTIDEPYYPFWFRGMLSIARRDTDLGNAAYTMQLEDLRPYD